MKTFKKVTLRFAAFFVCLTFIACASSDSDDSDSSSITYSSVGTAEAPVELTDGPSENPSSTGSSVAAGTSSYYKFTVTTVISGSSGDRSIAAIGYRTDSSSTTATITIKMYSDSAFSSQIASSTGGDTCTIGEISMDEDVNDENRNRCGLRFDGLTPSSTYYVTVDSSVGLSSGILVFEN
jgi:hypothetical protein